ncbi:MAG: hypothetical protein ABJB85_10360 [Nitrososphaerota archaeon]
MSSSSENVDVVSGEQQVTRLTTEIIPKVSSKVDCVFQSHPTLENSWTALLISRSNTLRFDSLQKVLTREGFGVKILNSECKFS